MFSQYDCALFFFFFFLSGLYILVVTNAKQLAINTLFIRQLVQPLKRSKRPGNRAVPTSEILRELQSQIQDYKSLKRQLGIEDRPAAANPPSQQNPPKKSSDASGSSSSSAGFVGSF